MKISGLIFDLDRTLIDSERAYRDALASVNLSSNSPDYKVARAAVKRRLGPGHVSARNRLLYFKEVLDRRGRFSSSELLRMADRYENALAAAFRRQWGSLRREALFRRIPRDLPRVVVTNENTRTQMIKMRAIDPRALIFPQIITSEEVGKEKPAREIFEAARKALGMPANRILVVGDQLADDVLPALKLGFQALLTLEFHRKKTRVPRGVACIGHLDELADRLEAGR